MKPKNIQSNVGYAVYSKFIGLNKITDNGLHHLANRQLDRLEHTVRARLQSNVHNSMHKGVLISFVSKHE